MIPHEIIARLYNEGFAFEVLQEKPDRSMLFYKDGTYFLIGGDIRKELTKEELGIVKGCMWIPSTQDLLWWLEDNGYLYTITYDNGGLLTKCIDPHTGAIYTSRLSSLGIALATIIIKILKNGARDG